MSSEVVELLTAQVKTINGLEAALRAIVDQLAQRRTKENPLLANTHVEKARRLYRQRRQRTKHFDQAAALFGEAPWDILLDLLVQEGDGRRVSVSSACYGSAVPATTALGHLQLLEQLGLIERSECENDRRRTHVNLTPAARGQLIDYLNAEIF